MLPSAAPGVSPSVIRQAPPPVTDSLQRPARSAGGGCGGGGVMAGGGGEAAAWSGWPPKRSLLAHAARDVSPARTKRSAAAFAPPVPCLVRFKPSIRK